MGNGNAIIDDDFLEITGKLTEHVNSKNITII